MADRQRVIWLGNAFDLDFEVFNKTAGTGAKQGATGLSGLIGRISQTPEGAAIHADLSQALAPRATATHRYYATISGTTITARLASFENKTVYAVLIDGANIVTSEPFEVRRPRRPRRT